MAKLSEKIQVELDSISQVLSELEKIRNKKSKSTVELAGIATFIHNFYNGIENILNQILKEKNVMVPKTESWHKDLLVKSVEQAIISEQLKIDLSEYLAFRHFFVHAYGFMLKEEDLILLINNIDQVFVTFKDNIEKYLTD